MDGHGAADGQVVGFSPAAGEDDGGRFRPGQGGHGGAGVLDSRPGGPAAYAVSHDPH